MFREVNAAWPVRSAILDRGQVLPDRRARLTRAVTKCLASRFGVLREGILIGGEWRPRALTSTRAQRGFRSCGGTLAPVSHDAGLT